VALRVLHTPTNTGNHPQGIARAERELGLQSRCIELWRTWIDYEVDETLARSGERRLAVEWRRWQLLRRALRDFDVIHFNFGSSLFPTAAPPPAGSSLAERAVARAGALYAGTLGLRDLPLLRRAGKTIIVTYQGDDARQGTGPDVPAFHRRLAERAGPAYYTEADDERKRRAIAAFDRFAHRIYFLNPDLGAFLPRRAEFMTYGHVDPRRWSRSARREPRERPVVLHAPSHRGIKGTRRVVEAVDGLRERGVDLDFRLVEGVAHAAVHAAFKHADLVIDQLYVGWYGGLAVEAMALGKPVVCFIEDSWADRYAPGELVRELPIVRATDDNVGDVLHALLTERRDWPELGGRGRAFVERWHDPRHLAARLRDAYASARSDSL
jgi:glycosyltransferase involved in cell wall biosynthesis